MNCRWKHTTQRNKMSSRWIAFAESSRDPRTQEKFLQPFDLLFHNNPTPSLVMKQGRVLEIYQPQAALRMSEDVSDDDIMVANTMIQDGLHQIEHFTPAGLGKLQLMLETMRTAHPCSILRSQRPTSGSAATSRIGIPAFSSNMTIISWPASGSPRGYRPDHRP